MPVIQMFGCVHASARLAQSAERKALNLVVVGSSPTVGGRMAWGGRSAPVKLELA